jgi:hypothetical protein
MGHRRFVSSKTKNWAAGLRRNEEHISECSRRRREASEVLERCEEDYLDF